MVARSNVEAEYKGMAFGICELLCLHKSIEELGVIPQGTMNLYCDILQLLRLLAIQFNMIGRSTQRLIDILSRKNLKLG